MLHLIPENPSAAPAAPAESCPEAAARLASIRHALRMVEPFAGGPASDAEDDDQIADAWEQASDAQKRCFALRSERTVCAATAGLEALLAARGECREVSPDAARVIAEELRSSLAELSRLVRA
ncbi:MAG TPA: hypothetical protein VM346_03735 [Sphingomicrobium sp.]|nr:hypothetical protein [Sphingomicrobium sp.]